jgi:hypothetical protein
VVLFTVVSRISINLELRVGVGARWWGERVVPPASPIRTKQNNQIKKDKNKPAAQLRLSPPMTSQAPVLKRELAIRRRWAPRVPRVALAGRWLG